MSKLDKAVARLEKLAQMDGRITRIAPLGWVHQDDLRLVLDALKAKAPEPVARAEKAVVRAALYWRASGDWPGGTYFEDFQDALRRLEDERAKAKGWKR